jgi:hypothetical protein
MGRERFQTILIQLPPVLDVISARTRRNRRIRVASGSFDATDSELVCSECMSKEHVEGCHAVNFGKPIMELHKLDLPVSFLWPIQRMMMVLVTVF